MNIGHAYLWLIRSGATINSSYKKKM